MAAVMVDSPIKKIYRLQENRYYSRDELSRLVNCSLEDATAFIKYMRDREVCKTDPSGETSFRYVGMVEFTCGKSSERERRIVFIEPKFLPEDRKVVESEGMDDVQKIILKAILKYRKAQQVSLFSNGRIASYEGCSTRLSTYLALLIDVMEKGVYQVPQVELVVNGQGDTDWNETFATVDPLFLQDGPCYVNTVNREIGYDDDTYISRLQMCLATECLAYFEDVGIAEPLGLFLESPYDGELSDFGSPSYQKYRIANELRTQFVDDKKLTLKLMEAVLEDKAYGTDGLEFQSFGISGFHALWEKAIKEVFSDELEKSPEQLGVQLKDDSKSKLHRPLKEFIDAPRWMLPGFKEGEDGLEAKNEGETDRLKPDFVAISKGEGKGTLFILDAKYYMPSYNNNSISGVPGVGDIDKQLLYQLAYQELMEENHLEPQNAFIFPGYEESNKVLKAKLFASVKVPILASAINPPEFRTYLLDGMSLLRRYVYNENDDANHGLLTRTLQDEH